MANRIYLPNGKQHMGINRLSKYAQESKVIALKQCGLTQSEIEAKIDCEAYEMYDMSRIEGSHCDCNGNGEFELLPRNDESVIEGGKDYMKCRICGGHSHL